MDYLNFDVELIQEAGREYQVTVHSPAGEAHETMRFPYDEVALELALVKLQNALLRSGGPPRRALTAEEQVVNDFGKKLFEALMTGEVHSCCVVSRTKADQEDKGLLCEESLALRREMSDKGGSAHTLVMRGRVALSQHQYHQADIHYQDSSEPRLNR